MCVCVCVCGRACVYECVWIIHIYVLDTRVTAQINVLVIIINIRQIYDRCYALFSHTLDILQEMTNNLYNNGAMVELRINYEKSKIMSDGDRSDPAIGQQDFQCVQNFPYLGSYGGDVSASY